MQAVRIAQLSCKHLEKKIDELFDDYFSNVATFYKTTI